MSLLIEPTIIAALVSTIASLIASLYAVLRKKSEKENLKKQTERLKSKAAEISVDLGIVKFTSSLESPGHPIPQEHIIDQLENRILAKLQEHPNANDEVVKAEIRNDLAEFKMRIEKIEKRFPDESKIEKIASINDALLSERIDQLKEQFNRLESKILNRWDVAITVSAIIGGISAVVATTYGFLKFIGKI
jgi:hypothetical protein